MRNHRVKAREAIKEFAKPTLAFLWPTCVYCDKDARQGMLTCEEHAKLELTVMECVFLTFRDLPPDTRRYPMCAFCKKQHPGNHVNLCLNCLVELYLKMP